MASRGCEDFEVQVQPKEVPRSNTTVTNRDKFVKKIEEELTCAICLDKFDDPKVLPCLHTYCRKCVESLVKKSLNTAVTGRLEGPGHEYEDIAIFVWPMPMYDVPSTVVCPQCREEHVLPEGGAKKLPTSFTFTNMVKLLEVHEADSKTLTCENGLDNSPATARCIDCDVYLCASCYEIHKKMVATKEHKTVSLEEIKTTGEKCFQTFQRCQVHEKEILKLYCRTCSKTICGDCTYVDHRSHEYVFIKDVREELRKILTEKLNTMKKLAGEARAEKEMADEVLQEHEAKVVSIHAEVDSKFEELSKLLRKHQAEVHQEIDTQAKAGKKPISTYVEEAELSLARLMSNVGFIERLLGSNDACEIATMADAALEQCKKLEYGQKMQKIEESCDWVLEGLEESKEVIQNISVKLSLDSAPQMENMFDSPLMSPMTSSLPMGYLTLEEVCPSPIDLQPRDKMPDPQPVEEPPMIDFENPMISPPGPPRLVDYSEFKYTAHHGPPPPSRRHRRRK